MKLTTPLLFVLIILMFLLAGCNKPTSPEEGAIAATLNDYTGLDGCSWVIKLENNDILEPVNLQDFNFELKENKKIWVKYITSENQASYCMVGPIVKIENIWDR